MAITAAEQYMIELINRARLDPAAEAARVGIPLNQGLPDQAGWQAITTNPKEPLAYVAVLDRAATGHSEYMARTGVFGHVQEDGTDFKMRLEAVGFDFTNSGWGENLAGIMTESFDSETGEHISYDPQTLMDKMHASLFDSPPHRSNMIGGNFREIAVAHVTYSTGIVFGPGQEATGNYVTENFGFHRSTVFVTGVAFTDSDGDRFYDIGEGRADLTFKIVGGSSDTTAAPGGYALSSAPGRKVTVEIGEDTEVKVDLTRGNVKLDVLNGDTLLTSGHIELMSGIANALALGIAAVNLTGSAASNILAGNDAANRISGGAGNDQLHGQGGKDRLDGGEGDDGLYSGLGNDFLWGQNGDDYLFGDQGNDRLFGGNGQDVLVGYTGNDSMVGGAGVDEIHSGVGEDTARGGFGDDELSGEGGNDRLYGDAGSDRLDGGAGDDTLYGGSGADRLTGDEGADKFVFAGRFGTDTISDFSVRDGDKLVLDDALWRGTYSENKVINTFAEVTSKGVVFDFGKMGTITLEGLTSQSGLASAIEIV